MGSRVPEPLKSLPSSKRQLRPPGSQIQPRPARCTPALLQRLPRTSFCSLFPALTGAITSQRKPQAVAGLVIARLSDFKVIDHKTLFAIFLNDSYSLLKSRPYFFDSLINTFIELSHILRSDEVISVSI